MSSLEERKRIREREIDDARREAAQRRVLVLQALLAAVLLSGAALFAYSRIGDPPGEALDAAPAEVLGTWTTDMERYAGASLTIEPERVTLGFAPGAAASYEIRSIRREEAAVHRAYLVLYDDQDGVRQEMEIFVYDGGQLRLKNPFEAIWTRVE